MFADWLAEHESLCHAGSATTSALQNFGRKPRNKSICAGYNTTTTKQPTYIAYKDTYSFIQATGLYRIAAAVAAAVAALAANAASAVIGEQQ